MTLSKNIKNGVIYPTELYYQYNLYLQKEYDLFYFIVKNEKIIEELKNTTLHIISGYIKEIDNLLETNISDDPENVFSVLDWEENLVSYYSTIKKSYKHRLITKKRNILSIEMFSRKIKLKKLNEKV